MKREVARWLLALGLLAARTALPAEPIAPEVAALNNLVRNGGFETGDALPEWWDRYPKKDEHGNRHLRDTTIAHTGKASGLLWSVAPKPPGKPPMQWNRYGIPVEGGSAVIVSYWTRTQGVAPAGAGCHFYDKDGHHLGFVKVQSPAKADDWTCVHQTVRVPDRAVKMGLPLYAHDKGKTWYDDVALIATPTATAVRATPTIDGTLDDACWAPDRAITAFAVHTGARLPTQRTRAWLAFDDSHLYVAFHCPHPKGATLKAEAKAHDGNTWLDDSIEVFLAPQHRRGDYVQFCVNCLGMLRDSRHTDAAWESGARVAVQRGEAAWTCELAIPFGKLGLDLDVGAVWGINLVRNDRVAGETATWSLGGFHAPERFGSVRIDADLTRFVLPNVASAVEKLRARAAALRRELSNAGLSADALAEPNRLLATAEATLDALRKAASSKAKPPAGGLDGLRRTLAAAADSLAEARQAALKGLFAIGAKGDGFRVVIARSLQKIRRSGPVLQGQLARRVRLDAARDEAEAFQLVVIPGGKPLKGVAIEPSPLRGPGGALAMTWTRVGYVKTAPPRYKTEYVGWWPDILLPPAPFDVPAGQRQPVWFTIAVPPDATPGLYSGQVTVRAGDQAVSVPVEVRVRTFRLPRPGTLATAFGLYAFALSRGYYGKASYRDHMPIADFARWCAFLAERRITPKNIAREYIDLKRDGDAYRADLSSLEHTVRKLSDQFAPYSYCLHRLPSSPILRRPGKKPDPEAWAAPTKAIADAWKQRGLPPKVYIYGMDEPHRQDYPVLRDVYTRVRKLAPGYPIMQTIGDPEPEPLVGLVDIWCPISSKLEAPFFAKRLAAGDTLWTYVCCSPKPPHANFFVDQPATDHRVLFWQTHKAGATGLLYWCVCWWPGLPTPASGKPTLPDATIDFADLGTYKSYGDNGDGLLVYPGPDFTPYSTIRLEVIRDGVEDYEYLALLARLVAKAKALPEAKRPPQKMLEQAEALCVVPDAISRTMTDYTKDPNTILERRRQVADMLDRLTALLDPKPQEARNVKAKHLRPSDTHRHALAQLTPSMTFTGQPDAKTWHRKLRRKLRDILAVPASWDHTIAFTIKRESETEEYTFDEVVFRSEPYADAPCYLLKPKGAKPPFPVMICLQGHSPGMHISVGRGKTKAERASIAGGRDIALQAVRHGWAALCIEQRAFGLRRDRKPGCLDAARHALMLGKTLTGERVFDVMRAIDFIAAQPDLDARRIGCMGNSSGGTVSFYAACVDPRIRLAVVSCSFCAFADSWMLHPHCLCGYLPGILEVADMGDLGGLVAPRHLVIVAGKKDGIARFSGVQKAFRQTKRIFDAMDCGGHTALLAADGGHQFYPDLAWPLIGKIREGWR